MSKKYDFDYIIIGSGPAGSTIAKTLARGKNRIAIVEGRYFGGANLNTRDLPYSVALDFSHHYAKIQSYPEVKNQDFVFNLPTVPACQLKTIIECGGNSTKAFEEAGVTCIKGYANFLDQHTIAVNERRITSNNFILATGSRLKVNEISGIDRVKCLSPESAIKITRQPKVAAVIGAGATGCEIASYYAELGIKVILFELSERLLPREDQEVGDTLFDYFTQKLSITALPNCKVIAVEEDEFSKNILFHHMGTKKSVRVDSIVLATGSQPILEYGLENAKVKYNNKGILVNKLFETSSKNIYAIGDAIGAESSTDRAMLEANTLANNLLNKAKNPANYQGVIRSVNSTPEVATVGYNEDDLLKRDRKYQKAIIKLSDTNASKIHNFNYGSIKLLADRSGKVIGATVVAPHAELIISEIALAIRHNLTALELASNPHSFNSYNYLVKLAAKSLVTKKH